MSQPNHADKLSASDQTDAFCRACAMEGPLHGIDSFARMLGKIAGTLVDDDDGLIVRELAGTIRALVEELEKTHEFFFRLHHPYRERFERDGWPEIERPAS
jgi:hypothetical protein